LKGTATSNSEGKPIFLYRLSPETFGHAFVYCKNFELLVPLTQGNYFSDADVPTLTLHTVNVADTLTVFNRQKFQAHGPNRDIRVIRISRHFSKYFIGECLLPFSSKTMVLSPII